MSKFGSDQGDKCATFSTRVPDIAGCIRRRLPDQMTRDLPGAPRRFGVRKRYGCCCTPFPERCVGEHSYTVLDTERRSRHPSYCWEYTLSRGNVETGQASC